MDKLSSSHEKVLHLTAQLAKAKADNKRLQNQINGIQYELAKTAEPPVSIVDDNVALARLTKYRSLKFWNNFYTNALSLAQYSYDEFLKTNSVPDEENKEMIFQYSAATLNSLNFLGSSQKAYIRNVFQGRYLKTFTPLVKELYRGNIGTPLEYTQFWFEDVRRCEVGNEAVSVVLSTSYPKTDDPYCYTQCENSIYSPDIYVFHLPQPISIFMGSGRPPLAARYMTICRAWFDHE